MNVRVLKSLYDVRSQTTTPAVEKGKPAYSIGAFAARVEALVADDRALIERLICFANAHDLKMAQDNNEVLERTLLSVRLLRKVKWR
jgi:hypothetical protein